MNDTYLIAFTQGSAGRFVKYLLYNLLIDSRDELKLCPITNSTHQSDHSRYTGYTPPRDPTDTFNLGNSHPKIWSTLKFDDPLKEPNAPKIFATHLFPDFKLIKDRLGDNVKIIIVTVDQSTVAEVVINDKFKNYYDLLTGSSRDVPNRFQTMPELLRRYEYYVGKKYPGEFVREDIIQIGKGVAKGHIEYLFLKKLASSGKVNLNLKVDSDFETRVGSYMTLPVDIDYPIDNILLLPYSEIATRVDNTKFIWLKKLEEFTGKEANKVTINSYLQYVAGREKLLKEYNL